RTARSSRPEASTKSGARNRTSRPPSSASSGREDGRAAPPHVDGGVPRPYELLRTIGLPRLPDHHHRVQPGNRGHERTPVHLHPLRGCHPPPPCDRLLVRTQIAFLISVGGITALFAAAGTTRSLPLSWILPGLAAHEHLPPFPTDVIAAVQPILAGLGIVVALVAAAVFLVPEQYEPRAVAAREELPRLVARLKRLGGYAPLLSKEFVDLQRSG